MLNHRSSHTARPRTRLVAAAAGAVLLAGCGAEIEGPAGDSRTVTVARCDEQVEYTTPQRAVVYEGGSADKMFALGLTEHVHGYVLPPANPPVRESPWASEYAEVEFLSDDLLNRELVVDANADFVVAGWNSGFSVERGITPEILDRLEIQSFMHSESCYNYPGFPQTVAPIEGLYTDLTRLGNIFDVPERASQLVDSYRQRVETVRQQAPAGPAAPVFVYDSGTAAPLTTGNQVPANDIVRLAGGRNIFADLQERYTEASWESVVEAQPEVIMIIDYGDQPAGEKIEFLKTFPATRSLPAVVNDNFFVLDYNEAISSPRNIDGLEKFAGYLRALDR